MQTSFKKIDYLDQWGLKLSGIGQRKLLPVVYQPGSIVNNSPGLNIFVE